MVDIFSLKNKTKKKAPKGAFNIIKGKKLFENNFFCFNLIVIRNFCIVNSFSVRS